MNLNEILPIVTAFLMGFAPSIPRILSDKSLKKMFTENNALFSSNIKTKLNIDKALEDLNSKIQETAIFKDLENKLVDALSKINNVVEVLSSLSEKVESIVANEGLTVDTINNVYNELIKFKEVKSFMQNIQNKVQVDGEKLDKLLIALGVKI